MKLQFSGHESFICKHFWLKKGYDFIIHKGNFNDESAVIDLGVGKNIDVYKRQIPGRKHNAASKKNNGTVLEKEPVDLLVTLEKKF